MPHFVEVAQKAGIAFERYDDQRGLHRIIEANGGGVALFDYDRNGILDIFLTNGCRLPRKSGDRSHPSQLFAGLDGSRYQQVTQVSRLVQFGYAHGCAVGDYDNDGFDDLYVTAFGANALWCNNGDGTFSDVTAETGTVVGRWSSSAGFGDFNRDGVLDLYVVNYVETSDDPPRLCPDPENPDGYSQCSPTMFRASDDVLFLGDGRGGFFDATEASGVTGVDGKGLGVVIFDANGDGWPDVYVANDGMPNFLYINVPGDRTSEAGDQSERPAVRFVESAGILGAAVNFEGTVEAGMGVAAGDYDGDGWIDLFLAHFFSETNTLYRNLAGRSFADETSSSGLGPASRSMLGFGTVFIDYDNDGRPDLFIANGHVDDFSHEKKGEFYAMPPQFFRNDGNGSFDDVSLFAGDYFKGKWIGRGVASGDLDNDGDLDLVVSHQRSPSAVLLNKTESKNRSVLLELIGSDGSNRSAIGALVEAEGFDFQLVRQVVGGTSFQSAPDRKIHIGMGELEMIPRITIVWPSGRTEEFPNVAPGRYTVVERRGLFQLATSHR